MATLISSSRRCAAPSEAGAAGAEVGRTEVGKLYWGSPAVMAGCGPLVGNAGLAGSGEVAAKPPSCPALGKPPVDGPVATGFGPVATGVGPVPTAGPVITVGASATAGADCAARSWVRWLTPSCGTWCAPSATAVSGWSRLVGTTPSCSPMSVATSGIRLDPPTR